MAIRHLNEGFLSVGGYRNRISLGVDGVNGHSPNGGSKRKAGDALARRRQTASILYQLAQKMAASGVIVVITLTRRGIIRYSASTDVKFINVCVTWR